ncbi:hypothetical protein HHUSO_G33450 [Huso huso]|uniref:USP domain-containing protein n=1 Tax=Huso huso TaxID=61971 RepID=A0ABR0Y8B4_HUSHU
MCSVSVNRSDHEHLTASLKSDPQNQLSMDKSTRICTFENTFLNCWFNSVMQCFLNITILNNNLKSFPESEIQKRTSIPNGLVSLLTTAVHNPGCIFPKTVIGPILKEISKVIPHLEFNRENDPIDLIIPFLKWVRHVNFCTQVEARHIGTCVTCGNTVVTSNNEFTSVINVMLLTEVPNTVEKLSNAELIDGEAPQKCVFCRSQVKRQTLCITCPLVISLPRAQHNVVLHTQVSSSHTVYLKMCDGKQRQYNSIICHAGKSVTRGGHYWSVLMKNNNSKKIANDLNVVDALPSCNQEETCGVYYFFEKTNMKDISTELSGNKNSPHYASCDKNNTLQVRDQSLNDNDLTICKTQHLISMGSGSKFKIVLDLLNCTAAMQQSYIRLLHAHSKYPNITFKNILLNVDKIKSISTHPHSNIKHEFSNTVHLIKDFLNINLSAHFLADNLLYVKLLYTFVCKCGERQTYMNKKCSIISMISGNI